MSLITSKTSLKGLKYSDFIQSRKVEPPTDLRVFRNTDASVGLHRSPDTKTGLGLEVEKRKEDVIRLTRATANSPQAIRFQTNQTLLNQQALVGQLKFDPKQVAIGAARVAGVTASAIAQAAGSGTGLRVLQGFVPLNGGYVVDTGRFGLLGAAVDSLNPFGTGDTQISKANIALRGKTISDGFIGTEFEEAVGFDTTALNYKFKGIELNRSSVLRPEDRQDTTFTPSIGPLAGVELRSQQGVYLSREFSKDKPTPGQKIQIFDGFVRTELNQFLSNRDETTVDASRTSPPLTTGSFTENDTYIGKRAERRLPEDTNKGPGKFVNQTTVVSEIKEEQRSAFNKGTGNKSLESRFFTSKENKAGTAGQDKLNVLSFETEPLSDNHNLDIIPFTIQNIPATGDTEYLYFRAYLDSMSDSYNGEWSGTRYIGRAEELYNYTGFKRGLQFAFKIAAHSPQELKPLYEKLNRLAGTTAPTYQNGLFMQGVFSKITIGDYVQKLPGFFTSVDFSWQTAYPWEIGDVDDGSALEGTPRVPHILDVSVSFQPVHDFAPQYDKTFIGFPSDTVIGQAS